MKKLRKKLTSITNENGQSTTEFAIVLFAVLMIIVVLGLFMRFVNKGMLVEHATDSASHHVEGSPLGVLGDLFCF